MALLSRGREQPGQDQHHGDAVQDAEADPAAREHQRRAGRHQQRGTRHLGPAFPETRPALPGLQRHGLTHARAEQEQRDDAAALPGPERVDVEILLRAQQLEVIEVEAEVEGGHPQHGQQHQHRTQQGVEEELVAGVDPVCPAPDADDEIHRDQAGFEHDVEQEQVLRREHADHQRFHQQEGGHVFAHPLVDRRAGRPARAGQRVGPGADAGRAAEREPAPALRPGRDAGARVGRGKLPIRRV